MPVYLFAERGIRPVVDDHKHERLSEVRIRQHTSAYVSIRQHTSAYVRQ